jgi:predicted neutral ceramidase superfamily lipid hydrolase
LSIEDKPLALGFAQAAGADFNHGRDISEGGISVILLSTGDWEGVLVTADSNNAISGLRDKLASTVEETGLEFIELCTSDTHAFAARNLTERGYFALGEDTKVTDITETVKDLASKAKASAAPCSISISRLETTTPLIGRESLDDFATLTSNAVSIAKTYAEVVVPTIVLLISIILFY